MTPFAQRLHAVFSTYATRSRLVLGMGFVCLLTIFILALIAANDVDDTSFFPYFVYCYVWLFAWLRGLSDQARWQFAPSRAAILPGYRSPHRRVLLGLYLVPVALLFIASILSGHVLPGVHAAIIAVVLAIATQSLRLPSELFFFAVIGFVLYGGFISFHEIPQLLVNNAGWANSGGLLLVVFCTIRVRKRIRALSLLREDDGDFATPTWSEHGQAAHTQQRGGMQRAAEKQTAGSETRTDAATFDRWLARGQLWRPAWRLLLPNLRQFNSDFRSKAFFVVAILFFYGGPWLTIASDDSPLEWGPKLFENVRSILQGAAVLSPPIIAIIAGNGMASRLVSMPNERLLPVTRNRYTDVLLGFFASAAVGAWATLTTMAWATGACDSPRGADPQSLAPLLAYVAVSLACVAFNFGITAVLTVTSTEFLTLFMIILACGTTDLVLLLLWLQGVPEFGWIPACVGAILAGGAGLLFIQHARVRWRERELG